MFGFGGLVTEELFLSANRCLHARSSSTDLVTSNVEAKTYLNI